MGKVVGILCTDKRWLDRLRRCCADEGLVYTLFRILEMILSKAGLLPKARKQAMLLALLQDDKTRLEMSMGDLQSALADKEARIKAMDMEAYRQRMEYECIRSKLDGINLENSRFADVMNMSFEHIRNLCLDRNAERVPHGLTAFQGTGLYAHAAPVVRQALPSVDFLPEEKLLEKSPDYCFSWGNAIYCNNYAVVMTAMVKGSVLVNCEDGFLRSVDTWCAKDVPERFTKSCSVVFDIYGCYYDASRSSQIERMLNDQSLVLSAEQLQEAQRLIRRIVTERLTKYNHQSQATPAVGHKGARKVLVVDQSYGDYAIRKEWADDSTFARMLDDAINENPDADILVKTHPDTMTGAKRGYYDSVKEEGRVFRVTSPVNPYSLFDAVDDVYVCSTQLGFEALMAGHRMHVYGMPFYAGWGLTIDRQKNPRRTRTRSLEEVFYAFYVLYTHWVDPETGRPCSIDKAIDWLLKVRDEYARYKAGR